MQQLPPHTDPQQNVMVDALQTYANALREQAETKKRLLERDGFLWLLGESQLKGAATTPPGEPPGGFPYQDSRPLALPEHTPSVETPLNEVSCTSEPAGADSMVLPLKRAATSGVSTISKVQTSEVQGVTLAVFSVHENHIV